MAAEEKPQPAPQDLPKPPDAPAPIPFKPQEMFKKEYNFNCQPFGYPGPRETHEWQLGAEDFTKELEDLMRKYKIVQVIAALFPKL